MTLLTLWGVVSPTAQPTRGHVILLEPNAALRSAIQTILAAERYDVVPVDSLDAALAGSVSVDRTVALVAWQSMEGLLAEEHRHDLHELSRRLRLVVMVPRRWARLLEATDLPSSVAGMIAKPFEADELLEKLEVALARILEPSAVSS